MFQTRGPATAKLLSPNLSCVRGTANYVSVHVPCIITVYYIIGGRQ